MKNSIFKNSIFKLILTASNIVFPLLVSPYIAKLFNQTPITIDAFGAYNDANGIITFFLAFAVFGVYNYGIRELSSIRDDKIQLSIVFTNLFFISIITSVFASVAYYFFIVYVINTMHTPIYLIMIIQILGNILSIEWLTEALEDYKFIMIKTIIVRFVYLIGVFTLVEKPGDVFIYAFLSSLSIVINNLISFVYIKSKIKFNFNNFNLIQYIKPLFAILLINNVAILYTQLDRFLLGRYFIGKVAVTEYSLPLNAVNMIGALLVSLLIVSTPRLSYYISKNQISEYNKLLKNSSRLFFMTLFPACIGLACLSYEAMYLYTSGAYAYTADILALFALRFLIISIYSIFSSQIMYVHHKEKKLVSILLVGGVLNFIFDVSLMYMDKFSPSTAIISTAVAEFIMLAIMYTYIKIEMKIDFTLFCFDNMKYLCFSIPFIPITYFVKKYVSGIVLTFIAVIVLCVLFYFALLLITKDKMFYYLLIKLKLKKATNSSEENILN